MDTICSLPRPVSLYDVITRGDWELVLFLLVLMVLIFTCGSIVGGMIEEWRYMGFYRRERFEDTKRRLQRREEGEVMRDYK